MLKIIETTNINASPDEAWKVLSDIENNAALSEHWETWNEGVNMSMVKSTNNTWSVLCQNGQTLIKTESRIVLKGGVFGKLLEPFMRLMVNRMAAEALAGFKFLVETGEPFEAGRTIVP